MKKMKKLLIGLAGLSLSVGAAIGVGLNADKGASEAKAAETVRVYADTTIVDMDWKKDNALTYAYVSGGSTNVAWPGQQMTETSVSGVFYLDIYDDDAKINILRVNPNNTSDVWSRVVAEWNPDIDLPNNYSTKNAFRIWHTGYGDWTAAGTWDLFDGTISDGAYLRGTIKGADHSSSATQIAMNGSYPNFDLTIQLDEDDEIKAVRYLNGFESKIGVNETGNYSVDNVYFPITLTNDKTFSIDASGKYILSVDFNNTYAYVDYYDFEFDNTASVWAREFLGSMTCNNGGNSDLSWNKKDEVNYWSWNDFADAENGSYAKLDDYAKNAIFGATPKDSDGTDIEYALKRHDACVRHYAWASSFVTNSSGTTRVVPAAAIVNPLVTSQASTSNAALIVIIAISAISLLAVGGYFFIRSKKEDR